MSRTLYAAKGRVTVRRAKAKDQSEGGLFLPGQEDVKMQEGTVLNIGADIDWLQVDDVVAFGPYAGVPVSIDDDELLVLLEEDILGKILDSDKL